MKEWLRKSWLRTRRSVWFPAVVALLPSFVISLAWRYSTADGVMGLIASFVAVEGLVILIVTVARPALQAEQLLKREGFVQVDMPEARILIGKIMAESPPAELADKWAKAFPTLKDKWVDLLEAAEKALRADAIAPENLQAMIRILASASAQIRARRTFDIDSLKRAACYLARPAAQDVTEVRVVNQIEPVLWFTPEMAIYFFDLFRCARNHPLQPRFTRVSIVEDEEWARMNQLAWQRTMDVDRLKGFVALNQMAGIDLKVMKRAKFSRLVEGFIAASEDRMQAIEGIDTDGLKKFIRELAFLMYCEDGQPVKVFCGRRYLPYTPRDEHAEPPIKWVPIENSEERKLYYDLFNTLDEDALKLERVNLAQKF